MKLFGPDSLIRKLIQEADELAVSGDTPDTNGLPEADGVGVSDVATEMAATPPAPSASPVAPGGNVMQVGTMPAPVSDVAQTLSKTVVNTEVLMSQLAELKSLLSTYEKRFEDADLTVDSAKVNVGSLLNALIYHAEKLQAFLGLPASPDMPAPVSAPASPEVPPAPPADVPPPAPGV